MGVEQTGVLSKEELTALPGVPSAERLAKGKVAVIECWQQIPCNPCEAACTKGAISIGEPLTKLPVLTEDKCDGCTLCLPSCPGLAIFMVDMSYSNTEATVSLPYELLPLPKKGDTVKALDREGKAVGEAKVVQVTNPPRFNRTPIIRIAVPKALAMDVRNIRPLED